MAQHGYRKNLGYFIGTHGKTISEMPNSIEGHPVRSWHYIGPGNCPMSLVFLVQMTLDTPHFPFQSQYLMLLPLISSVPSDPSCLPLPPNHTYLVSIHQLFLFMAPSSMFSNTDPYLMCWGVFFCLLVFLVLLEFKLRTSWLSGGFSATWTTPPSQSNEFWFIGYTYIILRRVLFMNSWAWIHAVLCTVCTCHQLISFYWGRLVSLGNFVAGQG
jgi:hypothetical protein